MLWGYKQQGELLMNARKMLLVSVVALMSVPVHGQQMFKCTVNGKPTFQQMPCSPTNVGERMPLKSLPGTGEGLREGEIGLIVEKERQEAYEQAKREAEARSWEEDDERRQATRMSREDEAKIENLKSDLTRRDTTRAQREAINAELNRVYGKYGVAPANMPSPPPPPKPTMTFGNKTIQTPNGLIHCQTTTIGNQTTENCH